MALHSRTRNYEADNHSYMSDNSSVVYSNYEDDQNRQYYDQADYVPNRDNIKSSPRYDVNIHDSKEVQLGDRNIYNIDKFQVNAELKAKRRRQICCFWIFFVALSSGGAASVVVTVIYGADPDYGENISTTVEPDFTSSTISTTTTTFGTVEPPIQLFEYINRDDWDANPPDPDTLPKMNLPAERILIFATGGSTCDDIESCKARLNALKDENIQNGLKDVAYNFYIGANNLVLEGTGWLNEGQHTEGADYNTAVGIAFIGDYSNDIPEKTINPFMNFLENAGADNLMPEEYIMIGQRDLTNTQSPGNALYALMKTWNNWSMEWDIFI